MIVLFRSCEANLKAGSLGDEVKGDGIRWAGKHKLEIIRKCYLSIQEGLTPEDKIIIVNDRTSYETLRWMKENTQAEFKQKDITPLPELRAAHPYPDYHPVMANCCPELTEYIVELAKLNPEELIYVCEDDYLHLPHALHAMKAVYEQGFEGFYAPQDYPDRYTLDRKKECEVHAGPYGHLRTIPSATLTVADLGKIWNHFRFEILRAGAFADDTWTWKAFSQVSALCPIPGHATHLQDGCVTPYIDWNTVYENIDI